MGLSSTIKFIIDHPLNRNQRLKAIARFAKWQIGSRLIGEPILMPFVDDCKLLVSTGMTGATQNIYCGLTDAADMAFTLHFLREGDLFADVGANIGSYSILAWLAGAQVVAFEPMPTTFTALVANVFVNRAEPRIDARNVGVGSVATTLKFTSDLGTMNRVVKTGESHYPSSVEVSVVTMDEALPRSPVLIKIDVEGFETEVLKGARRTLADPGLQALIIELNGNSNIYGFSDEAIRADLLEFGFSPFEYDFRARTLTPTAKPSSVGNTLFLRDASVAGQRLREGRQFNVRGQLI